MSESSTVTPPTDRDDQSQHGGASEKDLVNVTVSYVRAHEPVNRKFAPTATLHEVKFWAVSAFHLATSETQPWVLIDAHTDQAITPTQEAESLAHRGYHHEAQFRLSVEHLTGR